MRLVTVTTVPLVLACTVESEQLTFEINAHSVAHSEWSDPTNIGAGINSSVNDAGPTLSPDGRSLYFASNRSGGQGGNDLWVARRACEACPWMTPVNLGLVINSAALEAGPSLSRDGRLLFFTSDRLGGPGLNDIYVSSRTDPTDDFGWGAPVALGPGVNTGENEEQAAEHAATAGTGATNLYFARVPPGGTADIHAATVQRDGQTVGEAFPVVELNNPEANDQGASLRGDGREVVFFSTRPGGAGGNDLWTSTRLGVGHVWSPPVNLSQLNSAAADQQPSLSSDGRTLLFASNRDGGFGGQDIWMATRTP